MRDSRIGESLWFEWDGNGYNNYSINEAVFFTHGHVSLDEDLVRRALASSIQRDGISDSLSDSFRLLEKCRVTSCWIGCVDGDDLFFVCDDSGFTEYGDLVDEIIPVTFVEF